MSFSVSALIEGIPRSQGFLGMTLLFTVEGGSELYRCTKRTSITLTGGQEWGSFFTSALVEYFREEAGSERVTALIDDPRSTVYISALAQVEFVSAVHRMYREDVLSDEQLQQALSGFQDSVRAFQVEPLGGSVIESAERLLQKYGRTRASRTLDALHLATYSLLDRQDAAWQFVVADDRLHDVAREEGFSVTHSVHDE